MIRWGECAVRNPFGYKEIRVSGEKRGDRSDRNRCATRSNLTVSAPSMRHDDLGARLGVPPGISPFRGQGTAACSIFLMLLTLFPRRRSSERRAATTVVLPLFFRPATETMTGWGLPESRRIASWAPGVYPVCAGGE